MHKALIFLKNRYETIQQEKDYIAMTNKIINSITQNTQKNFIHSIIISPNCLRHYNIKSITKDKNSITYKLDTNY